MLWSLITNKSKRTWGFKFKFSCCFAFHQPLKAKKKIQMNIISQLSALCGHGVIYQIVLTQVKSECCVKLWYSTNVLINNLQMYQTVQMTRMAKLPELFTFFKTQSSKCQRPFDFFAPRPQSVVCSCKIQDEQVYGDVQNTIPNLQCFRPLPGEEPARVASRNAVLLSETNTASGRTWNAPVWDYFISMRLYSSKGKKK